MVFTWYLPRGIRFAPKRDIINGARKNFGFFALLSNGVKDPTEALRIYRSKDMIEKAFNDLKNRLNMRRTWVSSEENLEGKFFVQFVALIYASYVKRAMDVAGLFKNLTMQELFDDLDVIEKYDYPINACRTFQGRGPGLIGGRVAGIQPKTLVMLTQNHSL